MNEFDIDLLLLCGEVQSNPGPLNTFTDCFGNQYTVIIKISGSGFCSLHCLSYCLSGQPTMYGNIIKYCINVFTDIEVLFRQRTNFGSRLDLSSTPHYCTFMNDAIQRVQAGFPVDTDAWCEDAHFAAISLLYDIAIFIYSVPNKQWYVFSESASRGYICLLSVPGHFGVLLSVDAAPIVPTAAYMYCINWNAFRASGDVWQHMQHNYCFQHVFHFPANFSGVTIVNSPFVLSTQTSRKSSETERAQSKKTDFTCDHPTCNYVNKNCSIYAQNKESTDRKEASCPYLCPRKLTILNVIMLKNDQGLFIVVIILVVRTAKLKD